MSANPLYNSKQLLIMKQQSLLNSYCCHKTQSYWQDSIIKAVSINKIKKYFLLLFFIIFSNIANAQVNIDEINGQTLYVYDYDSLIVYDSGGELDNYNNGESYSFTVCSENCDNEIPSLVAYLTNVDIEQNNDTGLCYDQLTITTDVETNNICNGNLPGYYDGYGYAGYKSKSGCMTINFTSNDFISGEGFSLYFETVFVFEDQGELMVNQTINDFIAPSFAPACFSCVDDYLCDFGSNEDLFGLEQSYIVYLEDGITYNLELIGNVNMMTFLDGPTVLWDCGERLYNCNDGNSNYIFSGDIIFNTLHIIIDDEIGGESYSLTLTEVSCDDIPEVTCGMTFQDNNINTNNSTSSFNYNDCYGSLSESFEASDVVYKFERHHNDETNYFTLWNASKPLKIFVFDDCPLNFDSPDHCVAPSSIVDTDTRYVFELSNKPAGTYYIIVDGEEVGDESNFNIAFSCEGLTCFESEPITCENSPLSGEINNDDYNSSSGYSLQCIDNSGEFQGMFTSGEDIYSFTAPETGEYIFNLDIIGTSDLELFILKNCCTHGDTYQIGGNIVFITTEPDCDEECFLGSTGGNGQDETIPVPLMANQTINIVVDGFLGQQGSYQLSVVCNNLNCDNAQPIDCGQYVDSDNYSGENNVEKYSNPITGDEYINLKGNEKVFEITPYFTQDYSFFLSYPDGVELEMFLLNSCASTEVINTTDSSMDANYMGWTSLQAGHTYYLVVDGDASNGNGISANFTLNINCRMECQPSRPISCGQSDTWNNIENHPSNISFYQCNQNGTTENFIRLSGPEAFYEFTPDQDGSYTFELTGIDGGTDLDIFVLYECNPYSCNGTTDGSPDNSDKITVNNMNAGFTYIIVIDGDQGSTSDFTLTVTGCDPPGYCDLVTSDGSEDGFVIFDDTNLPNNATSYTVNFPLDSIENGNFTFTQTIDVDEITDLEYTCPFNGCYYICFNYINEEDELDVCCIKYCAEFKEYECSNYPLLNFVSEAPEQLSEIVNFSCGIVLGKGVQLEGADSTAISIIGIGVDTFINEYDNIMLPYGQYEVCCWEYDAACDYWDICCKTYCIPYIAPSENCGLQYGLENQGGNSYIYSPASTGISNMEITPTLGWDIICTADIPSSTCTVNFNDPGIYKVCYTTIEIEGSYVCCEYICIDDEQVPEECFNITYITPTEVLLTCNEEASNISWIITALCTQLPPPNTVDCQSWLFDGDNATWEIPQWEVETQFEICKYYDGCCDQTETCCDTICYTPFDPYVYNGEIEEFNYCDGITINSFIPFDDNTIYGSFTYSGPGSQVEGSEWAIYIADTGSPGGFKKDKSGSNNLTFDTTVDPYGFVPGDIYYICYSYIGEDGCREYCCIKIEIPTNCESHTPTYEGTDGSLDYSYTFNGESNEEIQNWYVSGDNFTYDDIDVLPYTYANDGEYYLCCLVWNPITKCYKLCCKKYCIENPLQCGINIDESYDQIDSTFDLDPFYFYPADAMWMIDLPAQYAGMIVDPHNFDPMVYGIPTNTKITVSVKYVDFGGCTKICCKEFCTSGPVGCNTCYDNCCVGEDLNWIESIKQELQQICNENLCNNNIDRAMWNDECVYIVNQISCLPDASSTVYHCNGDIAFSFNLFSQFNEDLFNELSDFQLAWDCISGDVDECVNPCPNATEIVCEYFGFSGPVSQNLPNWEQIGLVDQEGTIATPVIFMSMVESGHARYNIPYDNIDRVCFDLQQNQLDIIFSGGRFELRDDVNNVVEIDFSGWEGIVQPHLSITYNGTLIEDNIPYPLVFDLKIPIDIYWKEGKLVIIYNGNILYTSNQISMAGHISAFDIISTGFEINYLSSLCLKSCGDDPIPDPCPNPTELTCEKFETYQSGDKIADKNNWTSTGNSCIIAVEGNGNKYLNIGAGSDCDATYDFPVNAGSNETEEMTFKVWLPSENGINTEIHDPTGELIFINLKDSSGIKTQINMQVGSFSTNEYDDIAFTTNQWFSVRLVLDKSNTDMSIFIDNQLFVSVANTGFTAFDQFYISSQLTVTEDARVDDICISTCDGCNDDFVWDSQAFEDCTDLQIIAVNNTASSSIVTVAYDGTEIGSFDIYELTNNDPIFLANEDSQNATYNCLPGNTYLFCYKYLGEDGCYQYCCIKVSIPQSCGTISPNFIGDQDNLTYTYSYENSGDDVIQGWFSETGIFDPNQVSSPVTYTQNGTYYICCLLYNSDTKCYTLCCKKMCVDNPITDCNAISVSHTTEETKPYKYAFKFEDTNAESIEWTLDNTNQSLGSDAELTIDFEEYGFSAGTTVYVSIRYFDPTSQCWKVCCKVICLEDTTAQCSAINASYEDGVITAEFIGNGVIESWSISGTAFYSTATNIIISDIIEVPAGSNETVVCVTYYENGCCKVCCVNVCLEPSEINCDLFTITPIEFNGDWVFEFDDDNTIDGNATEITTPSGATVTLSGVTNMYTGTEQGTYIFCRTYTNECGDETQCCKSKCVANEVISLPITSSIEDDYTAIFTHMIIGGSTYLWDFGDGNTSNDPSMTIVHTYTNAGNYIATLTVTDACGVIVAEESTDVIITFDSDQFEVIANVDNPDCSNIENGSISLTIIGGIQPYTIDWLNGPDGELIRADLGEGEYTVFVSEAGGDDTTLVVTLVAPIIPIYSLEITHTSCGDNNGSVTIAIDNSVAITSYTLLQNSEVLAENDDGVFDNLGDGMYSVLIGYAENCTIEDELTIDSSQDFLIEIEDVVFDCQPTGIIESGLSIENYTFVWTKDNEVLVDETGANLEVNIDGQYTLTADNGFCIKSKTISVTLSKSADVVSEVTHTTCGDSNGSISITSLNDVVIVTIENTQTSTVHTEGLISELDHGLYTLLVTDANGCTHELLMTVDNSPASEIIVDATNANCGQSNGQITFSTVDGTAIVNIEDAEGNNIPGNQLNDLVENDYMYIVTDANGCTQVVFESIESEDGFTFSLGADQLICANENMEINSQLDDEIYSLQWYIEDDMIEDAISTTYYPTAPGIYILSATDIGGCTAEDTIVISYYPTLITVDGNSGSFVIGETVIYTVEGAESVIWSSNTTTLSCTNCESQEIMALTNGVVSLLATDTNGCTLAQDFTVNVENELIFPNYLTPNGDNINDRLIIRGAEQFSMSNLVVFNKWSQVVFESTDYKNDWGGVDNSGNSLPDGAYYYVLEYSIGLAKLQKTNDLTILKNE